MRQTRIGKVKTLACGFARTIGDTIVAIEADGSADSGEVSQSVTHTSTVPTFDMRTQFAEGGVLEEFSNA